MHQYFERMIPDGVDLWLVMPMDESLRGLSIIYLCAAQIHVYFPWRGFRGLGLARLSLLGSSGALLGTMSTFLLSLLLICGRETSGVPFPWGLL